MSVFETLRSAFRGITANKLRSALTLLGVMIGVGAVILLLAVGNGSSQRISGLITELGTNTITVRAGSGFGFGGGGGGAATTASSSSPKLTLEVANQVAKAGLGHIDAVVPEVQTSLTVANGATSQTSVSVIGTTPNYFTVTTAKVGAGSGFTAADVTSGAKVAVIGSTIATALFPTGTPVGQTIDVGGTTFTIVGVLATQASVGVNDPNAVVVAPISRVQRSFTGFGAISSMVVEAIDSNSVTAAQGEVSVELNQLLKYDPTSLTATAPYTVTNQATLLQTAAQSAQSFTVLLGAVAAISLLVGGIGVTNVMLVTVTERTREIGIRKALGATRPAILGQFLVEAAALTLLGGVLGVVAALFGAQFPINGTQPVVLGYSVPLALGVSVAIGVFFGVYPAARAAAMRPIQALRSI